MNFLLALVEASGHGARCALEFAGSSAFLRAPQHPHAHVVVAISHPKEFLVMLPYFHREASRMVRAQWKRGSGVYFCVLGTPWTNLLREQNSFLYVLCGSTAPI